MWKTVTVACVAFFVPCTSTGEIPPDTRPMFIRNQTIAVLDELVPDRLKPLDR